jgi:hypothetical protein
MTDVLDNGVLPVVGTDNGLENGCHGCCVENADILCQGCLSLLSTSEIRLILPLFVLASEASAFTAYGIRLHVT